MRSLKAAMDESKADPAAEEVAATWDGDYTYHRREFTAEMRPKHTLLAPQMSPVHFRFIEPVFASWGYRVKVLEQATRADIEAGLKFVNNDACYPSIIVVGQLVNALQSGDYDMDNTSVVISQTGGGCRATNYVAMLRLALKQAGLSHVPVIALSVNGIEKNSGFKLTLGMANKALKALVLGDVLTTVLLHTRPYELVPGSANRLYYQWLDRLTQDLAYKKGFSYRRAVQQVVSDFTALPKADIPRKPRVGLVGEILVKYHPDANNHAIEVIEAEGCEAVLPGLLDFFLYSFSNVRWQYEHLGRRPLAALISAISIKIMELYRRPANRTLARDGYFTSATIDHMLEKTEPILSGGNICGEGWFLTAEMLELIESGVPNIICAQPFACLPNHVTGKGMIKELRRRYPQANIVPIDYDPGASEVNQLNRIKLMISSALRKAGG
jgi:predicted nucleotide-binding protein (sugar kinase/HSP70/actin superfamily)